MNLETWYAGKCGASNTLAGEGTGFGDIIILHALEFLIGEQQDTGNAVIQKIFDKLQEIQKNQSQSASPNLLSSIKTINQTIADNSTKDSLVSGISKLIAIPFSNPPAQTSQYIASVKNNMARHKIVQPTYAKDTQGGGYGFNGLAGFLPFWRIFRNISYFIFVLLFLVYGFMIMFRVKINPQTSVNIQQALPKLIVTLFLITFSYAIVGLMFDLIWLLFFVGFSAFETFGAFGIKWFPDKFDPSTYGNLPTNLASGRAGLLASWFWNTLVAYTSGIPGALGAISGLPTSISILSTLLLAPFLGIVVGIILLIATLIAYGKLFFTLISSYISVIINLIFAPLILLGNVFPGSNAVGNWLRNTFANLIVFPVISFFLLLSYLFMVQPFLSLFRKFSPTALDHAAVARVPVLFPYQLGGSAGIYALVGLGLLFMAPKYVDMIKDALQVEPFKYGTGLGRDFQAAAKLSKGGTTRLKAWGSSEKAPQFIQKLTEKMPGEKEQKRIEDIMDTLSGQNTPS